MKEISTDEKVYEILCAKFDQMVNESEDRELFRKMYHEGIKYAEDLAKDKYWESFTSQFLTMEAFSEYSKVWKDIEIEPDIEHNYDWVQKGDDWEEVDTPEIVGYGYFFTVKADGFKARFPIAYLCHYIKTFKELSHHRGKHEIDYSMSPAYEEVYALQTA